MTTIKVSRDLRERVSQEARRRGLTVAAMIGLMLDDLQRADRLRAVGQVYARGVNADYAAELDRWGRAGGGSPALGWIWLGRVSP